MLVLQVDLTLVRLGTSLEDISSTSLQTLKLRLLRLDLDVVRVVLQVLARLGLGLAKRLQGVRVYLMPLFRSASQTCRGVPPLGLGLA